MNSNITIGIKLNKHVLDWAIEEDDRIRKIKAMLMMSTTAKNIY